ncbi:MAG: glycogen/starch/alpha-glucan phosphorylase, partial [Spirochaetales bacterium]|nr:glycogen/starch/alpha-glucan phosphorylase [Spirochaetales bacterium]
PWQLYESDPELKRAVDAIADGTFSPENPGLFRPLTDALLSSDPYMLLADYRSYVDCQAEIEKAYKNAKKWTKMSILNTAKMGKFSSDRAISEYARDIWGVKSVPVELGNPGSPG